MEWSSPIAIGEGVMLTFSRCEMHCISKSLTFVMMLQSSDYLPQELLFSSIQTGQLTAERLSQVK